MISIIDKRVRPTFIAVTLFLLIAHISICYPQAHNGGDHSAKADPRAFLSQPLTVGWRYNSDLTLNLTPAFDRDRVYLPLAGGIIVSLKAGDGTLNWRSEFGGELSASPVADDRSVYIASETASRRLERAALLAPCAHWAKGRRNAVDAHARHAASGILTLANGKLFGGGGDGRLYAFDSRTGELRWSFEYNAPFNSQPVVAGSRVYAGSEDGNLVVLDEQTGKLLWRYRDVRASARPGRCDE